MKIVPLRCGDLSNELILAWRDGESGAFTSWRIRRHLYRCWACRNRVSRLDEAIRTVQESIAILAVPDHREVQAAKWRFWQAAQALGLAESLRPKRGWHVSLRTAFAGAALICSLLFAAFLLRRPPAESPNLLPLRTISSLERIEITKPMSSVRKETFEFDISDGKKSKVRRIWTQVTAPKKGRCQSVWSDSSGQVQHAIFASDRGPSSIYSRESGVRTVLLKQSGVNETLIDALRSAFIGQTGVEAALLDWIGKQLWHPVSLAREMAEFRTETGAMLRMSRGRYGVRIEADSPVGRARVAMVLEGPSESDPPRLLEITWYRDAQVRFVRVSRREGMDMGADLTDFVPNSSPHSHKGSVSSVRKLTRKTPEAITQALLETVEVDVFGVLHRLGLCMRGGLRVARANGKIRVEGIISDSDRQGQVIDLLHTLDHRELIDVHIQSLADFRPRSLPYQPEYHSAVKGEPAPAEAWLRQKVYSNKKTTERDLFDVMNKAVSEAQTLSAESSAMRTLAEQFPAPLDSLLSNEAYERLLKMESYHSLSALASLRRMQALFAGFAPIDLSEPPGSSEVGNSETAWQDSAVLFQQRANVITRQMLELFSSHATTVNSTPLEIETQLSQLWTNIEEAFQASSRCQAILDPGVNERGATGVQRSIQDGDRRDSARTTSAESRQ